MFENDELASTIEWIARADFYNATPQFGGVSTRYRRKFLAGKSLRFDVEFYFANCIPSSTYEGTSSACWFRFNDSGDLWSTAHDRSYSEVLSNCGFLMLATDQGGNPLLLDPEAGTVYSFRFGYLRADVLTRPGKTEGWIEVQATRETVGQWSQCSWDNLQCLFHDVEKMTRRWHRGCLFSHISGMKAPELKHYRDLGIGIEPEMVDSEGRSPLEVARETGNAEVIEIVEAILRENP